MTDDAKPVRVRRDVLLRRFANGMSVFSVAYRYGLEPLAVEQVLRDALNRGRK